MTAAAIALFGFVLVTIWIWQLFHKKPVSVSQPAVVKRECHMPFYRVGHIPPAGFPCDWSCQVGAVSAESEATADRMAEERYVLRPGFELELLLCDPDQTDEAKWLVSDWHQRNEFWQEFCRDSGIPF